MSLAELLILFFLFTLGATGVCGYVFVLRPLRDDGAAAAIPAQIARDPHDLPAAQAAVAGIFRRIGEAMPGVTRNPAIQQDLVAAGFRWPSAIYIFGGIKIASALALCALATWLSLTFGSGSMSAFIPAVCGVAFGYMLPDRVLERMAQHRVARLRRGLPAALDLLVLAIEAGQGLDAAILDTSRGLRGTYPDLAAEFTQLQLELRANTTRTEALKNFVDRSRDLELRKFANLLIDTDRFGTSLGPALKTHARYLRIRFRQTAQERARKVAVKLIFPVFFLIFPSVVLVTLGPAVILVFQQLKILMG
ncbi:MAG TPA: type II secretion system F family protein [Bryobacteraceae bacterium]|jgi:tight adherence protein C|nr:type II secretion system F family protein [Bryobacteraceae bacterium]